MKVNLIAYKYFLINRSTCFIHTIGDIINILDAMSVTGD